MSGIQRNEIRSQFLVEAPATAKRLKDFGNMLDGGSLTWVILIVCAVSMFGSCAAAGPGAGFAALLAGLGVFSAAAIAGAALVGLGELVAGLAVLCQGDAAEGSADVQVAAPEKAENAVVE